MAGFVWGDAGARMTPAEIEAQRKIAQALMESGSDYSPVQHWSQGAARVAQALKGGLDYRVAGEASKKNEEFSADLMNKMIAQAQGAGASPVAPAAPVSPAAMPAPVSMAPTSGKIYSNDEPSPLDPPSGPDRDMAIRTVLAEAGNQGPVGQNAVASVIRNRAVAGNFGGDTVPGVIQKPMQFEPWNTPQGRSKMAAIDPSSAAYQSADQALSSAYAGQDPTMGATHFYAPKAQAALGRPAPAWDNGSGVNIADHRFFGGAGTPSVMAGASPSDVSAQSRPGMTGQAPAMAPAAPTQGGINPNIIKAITSPYASDSVKGIAKMLMQQQMQAGKVETVDLGNAVGVMDQRGNIIRQIPKGEPNKGPSFGVIGKDQFGNEQYGWTDPRTQSVTPNAAAAPAQPSTIPQAPPGVDPKIWIKEQSERAAKQGLPASWDDTSKLRGEVRQLPSYKNLSEAAPIYKTMVDSASRNTKASDLNLVYGLGKIFDPGSVVREGEMVMVKNTAGIPDWLAGTINALNGGAALTPETREAIMREAHSRISSYKSLFDQDAGQFRGIAERNRMNLADVLPDFGEFQPYSRAAAPPASAPPIDDLLKKYGGKR